MDISFDGRTIKVIKTAEGYTIMEDGEIIGFGAIYWDGEILNTAVLPNHGRSKVADAFRVLAAS